MTTSTGSGQSVPEHRTSITPRSGDTQVIGADGVAVNVDQEARAAADAAAAKAARKADAAAAKTAGMGAGLAPVLGDDGKPLNPPAGDVSDRPAAIAETAIGTA